MLRRSGFAESTPAPIIAGLMLLSTLAAAFCGHWALRRLRAGHQDRRRFTKAIALLGVGVGYLEIAILFLIATVPHHHGNPMAAHEASAVGSLRTLHWAASKYQTTHPEKGFPADLQSLSIKSGNLDESSAIDPALANGTKSGYRFTYIPETRDAEDCIRHYEIHADPVEQDKTGVRHFYTDDTGVIRYELAYTAKSDSTALQ